jgi:hypothetical protein
VQALPANFGRGLRDQAPLFEKKKLTSQSETVSKLPATDLANCDIIGKHPSIGVRAPSFANLAG